MMVMTIERKRSEIWVRHYVNGKERANISDAVVCAFSQSATTPLRYNKIIQIYYESDVQNRTIVHIWRHD